MTKFHKFADKVNTKFEAMTSQPLFRVDISAEQLVNLYQDSFPEGENEIYLERREHDCTICNKFIRDLGNAVTINPDMSLDTIWNIDNLKYPYDVVAAALHKKLTSLPIIDIFLHNEPVVGKQKSIQLLEDGSTKTWKHFYADIPANRYERDIATKLSKARSRAEVNLRSLKEISADAVSDVIELIRNKSIYRGEEHLSKLLAFQKMQSEFVNDNSAWLTFKDEGSAIRNSVIGSLLVDLTDGVDLEQAVKSFESKVAPSNYQRPKAVVTKGMLEKAIKTIDKLGVRDSLPRRHAVSSDVSINDVLFADRSTKLSDVDPLLDIVGVSQNQEVSKKALENAPSMSMDKFLDDVLPKTSKLNIVINSALQSNKVSISAPVNPDAPSILQWNNNFSWSYAGNVADSEMTLAVQNAGGRTDVPFRFTHSWNHNNNNNSLMDLHVFMPDSDKNFESKVNDNYGNYQRVGWNNREHSKSRGSQDVDYTPAAPSGYVPVENIIFPSTSNLADGDYECMIHNWSKRSKYIGFKAEVVILGDIYSYSYTQPMQDKEWVRVATVTLRNGSFIIKHHLTPESSVIGKNELVPVSLVMLSPNHWGNNNSGNKHFMFMTENEQIDSEQFRGYYNEFLSSKLHDDRKAFDLLSSKMMVEPATDGLSGYGFSETKPQEVFVKADDKLLKLTINKD